MSHDKDRHLVVKRTKGLGDCAFHATLGHWNAYTLQYETDDIAGKRKQVADFIRTSQSHIAFETVKALIKNYVLEGDLIGPQFASLRRAHEQNERADFNWDGLINQAVIDEYADFFATSLGVCLLPDELRLIAYAFDIGIDFYNVTTRTSAGETIQQRDFFHPDCSRRIAVQFNATDHYERMVDETLDQELAETYRLTQSEANKGQRIALTKKLDSITSIITNEEKVLTHSEAQQYQEKQKELQLLIAATQDRIHSLSGHKKESTSAGLDQQYNAFCQKQTWENLQQRLQEKAKRLKRIHSANETKLALEDEEKQSKKLNAQKHTFVKRRKSLEERLHECHTIIAEKNKVIHDRQQENDVAIATKQTLEQKNLDISTEIQDREKALIKLLEEYEKELQEKGFFRIRLASSSGSWGLGDHETAPAFVEINGKRLRFEKSDAISAEWCNRPRGIYFVCINVDSGEIFFRCYDTHRFFQPAVALAQEIENRRSNKNNILICLAVDESTELLRNGDEIWEQQQAARERLHHALNSIGSHQWSELKRRQPWFFITGPGIENGKQEGIADSFIASTEGIHLNPPVFVSNVPSNKITAAYEAKREKQEKELEQLKSTMTVKNKLRDVNKEIEASKCEIAQSEEAIHAAQLEMAELEQEILRTEHHIHSFAKLCNESDARTRLLLKKMKEEAGEMDDLAVQDDAASTLTLDQINHLLHETEQYKSRLGMLEVDAVFAGKKTTYAAAIRSLEERLIAFRKLFDESEKAFEKKLSNQGVLKFRISSCSRPQEMSDPETSPAYIAVSDENGVLQRIKFKLLEENHNRQRGIYYACFDRRNGKCVFNQCYDTFGDSQRANALVKAIETYYSDDNHIHALVSVDESTAFHGETSNEEKKEIKERLIETLKKIGSEAWGSIQYRDRWCFISDRREKRHESVGTYIECGEDWQLNAQRNPPSTAEFEIDTRKPYILAERAKARAIFENQFIAIQSECDSAFKSIAEIESLFDSQKSLALLQNELKTVQCKLAAAQPELQGESDSMSVAEKRAVQQALTDQLQSLQEAQKLFESKADELIKMDLLARSPIPEQPSNKLNPDIILYAGQLFRAMMFEGDLVSLLCLHQVKCILNKEIDQCSLEELLQLKKLGFEAFKKDDLFADIYNRLFVIDPKKPEMMAAKRIMARYCELKKYLSAEDYDNQFIAFREKWIRMYDTVINQAFQSKKQNDVAVVEDDVIARLKNKILELEAIIQETKQSIDIQAKQREAQFSAFEKNCNELNALKQSYDAQLLELDAMIAELKQQCIAAESVKNKAQGEHELTSQQVSSVNHQLESDQAALDALLTSRNQLKKKLEKISESLLALNKQKMDIACEIDKASLEREAAIASLQNAQKKRDKINVLLTWISKVQSTLTAHPTLFREKCVFYRERIYALENSGRKSLLELCDFLSQQSEFSHLAWNEVRSFAQDADVYFDDCLNAIKEVVQQPEITFDRDANSARVTMKVKGFNISWGECADAIRDYINSQLSMIGLRLDAHNKVIVFDEARIPTKLSDFPKTNYFAELIKRKIHTNESPDRYRLCDDDPTWSGENDSAVIRRYLISSEYAFDDIVSAFFDSVEISAGNDIIVENDITLRGVDITLFSQGKITLKPDCKIDTSGNEAPHFRDKTARDGESQRTNSIPEGRFGDDGLCGYEGQTAGDIFLSARNEIANIETLHCRCNGGKGADGQQGGKGDEGRQGLDTENAKPDDLNNWRWNQFYDNLEMTILAVARTPGVDRNGNAKEEEVSGPGGEGGKKGWGGEGGAAGRVYIDIAGNNIIGKPAGKNIQQRISANKGEEGKEPDFAFGGHAGKAGFYGKSRFITREWRPKRILGARIPGFGLWKDETNIPADYYNIEKFKRRYQGKYRQYRNGKHYSVEYTMPISMDHLETVDREQYRSKDTRSVSDKDYANTHNKKECRQDRKHAAKKRDDKLHSEQNRQSLQQKADHAATLTAVRKSHKRHETALSQLNEAITAAEQRVAENTQLITDQETQLQQAVAAENEKVAERNTVTQALSDIESRLNAMQAKIAQAVSTTVDLQTQQNKSKDKLLEAELSAKCAKIDLEIQQEFSVCLTQTHHRLEQQLHLRKIAAERNCNAADDARQNLLSQLDAQIQQLQILLDQLQSLLKARKAQKQRIKSLEAAMAAITIDTTVNQTRSVEEHAIRVDIDSHSIAQSALTPKMNMQMPAFTPGVGGTEISLDELLIQATQLNDCEESIELFVKNNIAWLTQNKNKKHGLVDISRYWTMLFDVARQHIQHADHLKTCVMDAHQCFLMSIVNASSEHLTEKEKAEQHNLYMQLFYSSNKLQNLSMLDTLRYRKFIFAYLISLPGDNLSESDRISLMLSMPAMHHYDDSEKGMLHTLITEIHERLLNVTIQGDLDHIYFVVCGHLIQTMNDLKTEHQPINPDQLQRIGSSIQQIQQLIEKQHIDNTHLLMQLYFVLMQAYQSLLSNYLSELIKKSTHSPEQLSGDIVLQYQASKQLIAQPISAIFQTFESSPLDATQCLAVLRQLNQTDLTRDDYQFQNAAINSVDWLSLDNAQDAADQAIHFLGEVAAITRLPVEFFIAQWVSRIHALLTEPMKKSKSESPTNQRFLILIDHFHFLRPAQKVHCLKRLYFLIQRSEDFNQASSISEELLAFENHVQDVIRHNLLLQLGYQASVDLAQFDEKVFSKLHVEESADINQLSHHLQQLLFLVKQDTNHQIHSSQLEQWISECKTALFSCHNNEKVKLWSQALHELDELLDQRILTELKKRIHDAQAQLVAEAQHSSDLTHQKKDVARSVRALVLSDVENILSLLRLNMHEDQSPTQFSAELSNLISSNELLTNPNQWAQRISDKVSDIKKRYIHNNDFAEKALHILQDLLSTNADNHKARKNLNTLYYYLMMSELSLDQLKIIAERLLPSSVGYPEACLIPVFNALSLQYQRHIYTSVGETTYFQSIQKMMHAEPKLALIVFKSFADTLPAYNASAALDAIVKNGYDSQISFAELFESEMKKLMENSVSNKIVFLSQLLSFYDDTHSLVERNLRLYSHSSLNHEQLRVLISLTSFQARKAIDQRIENASLREHLHFYINRLITLFSDDSELQKCFQELTYFVNYIATANLNPHEFVKNYQCTVGDDNHLLLDWMLSDDEWLIAKMLDAVDNTLAKSIMQDKPPTQWHTALRSAYWKHVIIKKLFQPFENEIAASTNDDFNALYRNLLSSDNIRLSEEYHQKLCAVNSSYKEIISEIYTCQQLLISTFSIAKAQEDQNSWICLINGLIHLGTLSAHERLRFVNRVMSLSHYFTHFSELANIISDSMPENVMHRVVYHFLENAIAAQVHTESSGEAIKSVMVLNMPAMNTPTGIEFIEMFAKVICHGLSKSKPSISAAYFNQLFESLLSIKAYEDKALIADLRERPLQYWQPVINRRVIAMRLEISSEQPNAKILIDKIVFLQKQYPSVLVDRWLNCISKNLNDDDIAALSEIFSYFAGKKWQFDDKVIQIIENVRPVSHWLPTLQAHFSAKKTLTQRTPAMLVEAMRKENGDSTISTLINRQADAKTKLEKMLESIKKTMESEYHAIQTESDIRHAISAFKQRHHCPSSDFLKNGEPDEVIVAYLALLMKAVSMIEKKTIFDTQLIAIICFISGFDSKNYLANISTGEGKALIARMLAITAAMRGEKVDLITSSKALAIPQAEEAQKLVECFGFRVCTICDEACDKSEDERKRRYANNDIFFGDLGSFQRDLLLTEYMGKDIRPRQSDRLIGDEIDSMLIDNADKVLYISHLILDFVHLRTLFVAIWGMTHVQGKDFESPKNIAEIAAQCREEMDNGTIAYPQHLRQFIEDRLSIWIKNAYAAERLERNRQYFIPITGEHADVPIITDLPTGVEQFHSQWSNGLHQFIQLKESKVLTDETLKAVFISNVSYVERFRARGRINGMTGTLGKQSGIEREFLSKIYDAHFFTLPRLNEERFVREEACISGNTADWQQSILDDIQDKLSHNRAILLICEDKKTVKEYEEFLLTKLKSRKCKIHIYDSLSEANQYNDFYLESGDIVIATNIAGRGTDLKIRDNSQLENSGGLHVISSYVYSNERTEIQGEGRAGRKGQPGSARYCVFDPRYSKANSISIEQLCEERDQKEALRLDEALRIQIPRQQLVSRISEKYYALQKKIMRQLETVIPSYVLPFQLKSLQNKWAMWLEKHDRLFDTANAAHESIESELFSAFDRFESEIMTALDECDERLVDEPGELTSLGRCLMAQGDAACAIRCFDKAIEKNPNFAAFDYYYKAQAILAKSTNKHEASQALDAALSGFKAMEAQLRAANETVEFTNRQKRQLGQGMSVDTFTKQNVSEIETLQIHMRAVREALGSTLSPFDIQTGVFSKTEVQQIFDKLCDNLPEHIRTYHVSKHTVVEKDNNGQIIFSYKGKRFALPSKFDDCKEAIFNLFVAITGSDKSLKERLLTPAKLLEVMRAVKSDVEGDAAQLWAMLEQNEFVHSPRVDFHRFSDDDERIKNSLNEIKSAIFAKRKAIIADIESLQITPEMQKVLEKKRRIDAKQQQHSDDERLDESEQVLLRQFYKRDAESYQLCQAIYSALEKSIGSLHTIHRVELKNKTLHEFFTHERLPPIVLEYAQRACADVLSLVEFVDKDKAWRDALKVALIGTAQIVAGAMIIACCPAAAQLGRILINEGIGDISFAVQSHMSGNFSWDAYRDHKVQSLMVSLAAAGVSTALKSTTAASEAATTSTEIAKTVTKELMQAALTVAVNMGTHAAMSQISEQVVHALMSDFKHHFRQDVMHCLSHALPSPVLANPYTDHAVRNTEFENLMTALYKKIGVERANTILNELLSGNELNVAKWLSEELSARVISAVDKVSGKISGLTTESCSNSTLNQVINVASFVSKCLEIAGYAKSFADIVLLSSRLFEKLNHILQSKLDFVKQETDLPAMSNEAIQEAVKSKSDQVSGLMFSQIESQVTQLFTSVGSKCLSVATNSLVDSARNAINNSVEGVFSVLNANAQQTQLQASVSSAACLERTSSTQTPGQQSELNALDDEARQAIQTEQGEMTAEEIQVAVGKKSRVVMKDNQYYLLGDSIGAEIHDESQVNANAHEKSKVKKIPDAAHKAKNCVSKDSRGRLLQFNPKTARFAKTVDKQLAPARKDKSAHYQPKAELSLFSGELASGSQSYDFLTPVQLGNGGQCGLTLQTHYQLGGYNIKAEKDAFKASLGFYSSVELIYYNSPTLRLSSSSEAVLEGTFNVGRGQKSWVPEFEAGYRIGTHSSLIDLTPKIDTVTFCAGNWCADVSQELTLHGGSVGAHHAAGVRMKNGRFAMWHEIGLMPTAGATHKVKLSVYAKDTTVLPKQLTPIQQKQKEYYESRYPRFFVPQKLSNVVDTETFSSNGAILKQGAEVAPL